MGTQAFSKDAFSPLCSQVSIGLIAGCWFKSGWPRRPRRGERKHALLDRCT